MLKNIFEKITKIKEFFLYLLYNQLNNLIMEDLEEKLWKLEEKFYSDEEVISLINQLKTRFKTLESEVFTKEEFDSYEYSQLCEDYYSNCRDLDPDDYGIFNIMWFD